MTIEQTRAQISAAVWQAIAQSGIDLSTVPQEQQQKLVAQISEKLLTTVDDMLEEAQGPPLPIPAPEDDDDGKNEKVLWQGRPFLSLVEKYVLTNERIKLVKGMLSRDVENFELIRIQDIDFKQNVSERVLGVGDIVIRGADPSDSEVVLRNVKDPESVYETLRRAWLEARKRYGLQFREFM
jgi:Bacterial PH domain